ncbi:ligase-associated DNA damage response endonuclease PdeM [Flavobacterium sp. LC2016-12]|uniref:ligase-associated DNA damage response endonuclease PdeM n=1 Tax=Flavobacterium sp. LC2016-12 TaxID=2783794 RepID=UPI00188B1AB0|nr:ligase-associated DNA damage response endonuclease PdeM [Flavobacterium sp. LC2016-12]MBF4466576.1 ligase-associated DNA damage response endonuclease PdeM [Flavobacterium sp. LC2016-12]
MRILINNQNFILHQSGAVFWEEKKMLLISDVHLGKVTHFRKHGIGIPKQAIFENFNRLKTVLELFDAETIIFLGDLFHSKINTEWDFFAEWIKEYSQKIILVEGNHDIISKSNYEELNIEIYNELIIDDFLLTHHPTEKESFFNFCGHIHPAIQLRGLGRQFLNLPCFFRKSNQLIFPAFGEFTGTSYMTPTENDKAYAITKEGVIEISIN